jgi:hypothetical protein
VAVLAVFGGDSLRFMKEGKDDRVAGTTDWWSAVQAIAWLVERSDAAVERTARLRLLRALNFLVPSLQPRSFDGKPPVSLGAAPGELLVPVRRGQLVLQGRQRGGGPLSRVAVRPDDRLQDHGNALCLGGADVYRGGTFWSDLWLPADACRACWPGEPTATAPAMTQPERRAGRKPQKIEATLDWLRQTYPNGIPPAVKNEVLLQDLAKDGIAVGESTLRRALAELKIKSV